MCSTGGKIRSNSQNNVMRSDTFFVLSHMATAHTVSVDATVGVYGKKKSCNRIQSHFLKAELCVSFPLVKLNKVK